MFSGNSHEQSRTQSPPPLGRGTKSSGIIHLFSPQIPYSGDLVLLRIIFQDGDTRTEIDTIFQFWEENIKNSVFFT